MLKKLKIFTISFSAVFLLSAVPALALTNSDAANTPLHSCSSPTDTHAICKTAIQNNCASGKAEWQSVGTGKDKKWYVVCAEEFGTGPNKIWGDLKNIVNALAAGVGVVAVAVIVVGGIQYTMAGDQPGKVEEAKKRIANAIFALVAFFLTWAFLQWIIPTGIWHP